MITIWIFAVHGLLLLLVITVLIKKKKLYKYYSKIAKTTKEDRISSNISNEPICVTVSSKNNSMTHILNINKRPYEVMKIKFTGVISQYNLFRIF